MCGKLFCHNGQGSPNYGRMVRFNNCKASFFDDHTKDYGQVDVGTKCGEGMVGTHRVCVWGGQRARELDLNLDLFFSQGVQPERVCDAEDGLQEHQLLSQMLRSRCESASFWNHFSQ